MNTSHKIISHVHDTQSTNQAHIGLLNRYLYTIFKNTRYSLETRLQIFVVSIVQQSSMIGNFYKDALLQTTE